MEIGTVNKFEQYTMSPHLTVPAPGFLKSFQNLDYPEAMPWIMISIFSRNLLPATRRQSTRARVPVIQTLNQAVIDRLQTEKLVRGRRMRMIPRSRRPTFTIRSIPGSLRIADQMEDGEEQMLAEQGIAAFRQLDVPAVFAGRAFRQIQARPAQMVFVF